MVWLWVFLPGFLRKQSMGSHPLCKCVPTYLHHHLFNLSTSCDKICERHMSSRDIAAAEEARNSPRTRQHGQTFQKENGDSKTHTSIQSNKANASIHIYHRCFAADIFCLEEPLYFIYSEIDIFYRYR